MKKAILAALSFCIACSIGCANSSDTKNEKTVDRPADSAALSSDEHTSAHSLDWSGTYKGVLPCADCEGLETVIVLNNDSTYSLKTNYLGKGAGNVEKGTFSWNEAGNTITLSGGTYAPTQYFVGENRLTQLDLSGQKITGALADKYVLTKQ